jgi:BMFP domain-containing protein YqiC
MCSRDPHLAIDQLAADGALDDATVRELSRTLRDVSVAIAIANAVGTRSRDRAQGKLTIIDMWCRDEGLPEEAAVARARERARALLARARDLADRSDDPDLPTILDTGARTVEAYLCADLFVPSGT